MRYRYRSIIFALALLPGLQAFAQRPPRSVDSPTNFYLRLAEAVTSIEGHATLYFNQGKWLAHSRIAGDVHWTIDPKTTADVQVQYVNRALVSASLKFNKPIHVWLPVTSGASFLFTSITYDRNGNVFNEDRQPDNKKGAGSKRTEGNYVWSPKADRILSIATSPEMFLKGKILENIDSLSLCDEKEQNCKPTSAPMIYEVEIRRAPTSPALIVSLGPDASRGIT